MLPVRCSICLDDLPIDRFRSIKCGHTFCDTCLQKHDFSHQDKYPCPTCRKPFTQSHIRRIFLELVYDPASLESMSDGVRAARRVADGLDKMDQNAPVRSVERAGREIEKALQTIEGSVDEDRDLARTLLLTAINDFTTRIAPLFTSHVQRGAELDALTNHTLPHLHGQLRMSKTNLERALSAAEDLNTRLVQIKDENDDLKAELQDLLCQRAMLESQVKKEKEDKKKWRALVEEHKSKSIKYKKKIATLRQEKHSLEAAAVASSSKHMSAAVSEDQSLIVLPNDRSYDFDYQLSDGLLAQYPESSQLIQDSTKLSSEGMSMDTSSLQSSPCPQLRTSFYSAWNLPAPGPSTKKRKHLAEAKIPSKPTKPQLLGPPLMVDERGRPKGLLSCGEKKKVKVRWT